MPKAHKSEDQHPAAAPSEVLELVARFEQQLDAYQLRRYAWSAKLPLSILCDFEEFAVYDCRIRPHKDDPAASARIVFCTFRDLGGKWGWIAAIFSHEAVLKGSFDKFAESSKGKRGTSEVDAADVRYNSGLFHFKREKDRHEAPDELTLALELDDKLLRDILRGLYYPDSPYEFSVLSADILGQKRGAGGVHYPEHSS